MGTNKNQYSYMYEWQKEKMSAITVKYKKEFVTEFKKACQVLGISQSDVIRQAMTQTIERAQKKKPQD